MDYDEIHVESLVLDESFQRYCLGADQTAKNYWEDWLANHPDKKTEFFKARELYTILNGGNDLLNFERDRVAFYNRLVNEGILHKVSDEPKLVRLEAGRNTNTRNKFTLIKFFAAAAVLIALVFGFYMFTKDDKKEKRLADAGKKKIEELNREPGINKATLTLADGTTIVLDSSAKGVISQQGGVQVINAGGLLSYKNGGDRSEVLFNTISTPRGGQYQLLLADGSKVWLNALSSLRFPSVFNGKDRNVELAGEGYFEIAHHASMPFHVKVGNMDVEILGTHFNVMAYGDEEFIKTTLVQGKVKIRKEGAVVILAPGQQAQVNKEGVINLNKNADVEEALAWKNGVFQFDGADMRMVMRHIGRWYNIEPVLVGDMKNIHLSGKVSRNLNLAQVVQVLEDSGIDIKIDGNKMIASPKP